MYFRKDWNARPRFETEEEGLFVGRNEFLGRLNSHFISRSGGTILISGVRGVGKTALVDRALVGARKNLQKRYWEETWKYLEQARPWHVIDLSVRRTLLELQGKTSADKPDYLRLQQDAEKYAKRPRRWWRKFDPVDLRIRRMHEASRWQLLVLKFSASDISGAQPEPGQQVNGKPRIDPEKLLRSIIRKLYVTFYPSGPEPEAKVLQWSLRDKAKRQLFFDTLDAAYKKSISKSYKEIISNSITALIKQTQSSTLEGKINAEKLGIVIVCVIACVVFALLGWKRAWVPLRYLQTLGIPVAITGYILLTWGFKWTREKSSDQSRQASFSYEYDYSLHQMRQDVESLVRTLSPSREEPHDPFQCFRRTVIVFDELDKLDEADQQLDDIITHFKNFFTLSEAVFVFLTDHEFYEHLIRETVKAQLARHYPPQHTFFTEKIYLRKPEFVRFREAFFNFTETAWIEKHARSLPADPMLIDDLLKRDEKLVTIIKSLPLDTLTQLYVQRGQYQPDQTAAIEREFDQQQGMSNAKAVAQIWAGQAARVSGVSDLQEMRKKFYSVKGWEDPEAVSFLYHQLKDFGDVDQKIITKSFHSLTTSFLSKYDGVDRAPFTLSDLARALCFQTRNHYFDLYNAVYDYVSSYEDGAPVLVLDEGGYAHEPKLWSRYQQLLEIAFDSAREKHPSREYFNALLMESLYRALDKRRTGESVKIGDILFPPRDELASVAITLADPEKSQAVVPVVAGDSEGFQQALTRLVKLASEKLASPQTGQENGSKVQVQPFTDRDSEKINQAIVRLLRLALAHKAIRSVTTNFEAELKKPNVKPSDLAELEFAWNDDSHSVIRSVVREEYEEKLVKFWKDHRVDLEPFEIELSELWKPVPVAGESARMLAAIRDLKMKADVVDLRQETISGPDASALQANVGTWNSREALWPRIIMDRIRAEEDADVIEEFDKPTNDALTAQLTSRKVEIEAKTPLRIRAIIRPRNTGYAIYLIVSPLPTTDVDLALVKSLLPEKTPLFWYVTGKESPEFTVLDGIRVYASPLTGSPQNIPRAATLISDYREIASKQRLEQIALRLEATQYKDVQLAQRAGAEVMGPIVPFSDLDLLAQRLGLAVKLLTEKRDRLRAAGLADWPDLEQDWSRSRGASRLASEIVEKGSLPPIFLKVVQHLAANLFTRNNSSKVTPEVWVKTFLAETEGPNAITERLLNSLIAQVTQDKMDTAIITNSLLRAAIDEHFVPWLANGIQAAAETRAIEVTALFTMPEWTRELERQRRNLLLSPLPSTPGGSPPAPPPTTSRKRAKK